MSMRIGIVGVSVNNKNAVVREISKRHRDLTPIVFSFKDTYEDEMYKHMRVFLETYFLSCRDNIIANTTIYDIMGNALLSRVKGRLSIEQYNILYTLYSIADSMLKYDVLLYIPYRAKGSNNVELDRILQSLIFDKKRSSKIIVAEDVFEKTITKVSEVIKVVQNV